MQLGEKMSLLKLTPFFWICSPFISFPGLVRYLLRLSVVEQEKPEKAGQNSDQGAEKSEPKWEVPARVRDEIGFCPGHDPGFLVLVACHSWQPQSAHSVRI